MGLSGGGEGEDGDARFESRSPAFVFKLFVNDIDEGAYAMRDEILHACKAELEPGQFRVDLISVRKDAYQAEAFKVLATPTIVRVRPSPTLKVVGDLLDIKRLTRLLELAPSVVSSAPSAEADQNLLESVFELCPDGLVLLDQDENVVAANSVAETLLGDTVAHGQRFGMPLIREDKADIELGNIYAEMRSRDVVWTGQRCRVVSLRDISERKRLESQLEALNADLQHHNEALRTSNDGFQQFASMITHDFKSPLRNLSTLGEILKEDFASELGVEGERLIDLIAASAGRLHDLVDQLLAFSDVGREVVRADIVSLKQVVANVVTDLGIARDEDAVVVTNAACHEVVGNEKLLYQLVLNLMSNALKFVSKARPPIIVVTTQMIESGTDRAVKLTVIDNGIGFDPALSEEIFLPLRRLHPSDRYRGSGLGLATVKRIVELHGGEVFATGEKGLGAQIGVILPVGVVPET